MKVIIKENSKLVALHAADIINNTINLMPRSVLGLASGKTPLELYHELIFRYKNGRICFKQCTFFNLDEYLGLSADSTASFKYFMENQFFKHVDVEQGNMNIPNGQCTDTSKECLDYEHKIKAAGGIDLQILGIGINGHIGFNEPTSSLASRTRVKILSKATLNSNKENLRSETKPPVKAITMGIQTILEAKQIILLATGLKKAGAIAKAIEGPLQAFCPASALQLHPNAIFIIDEQAASELTLIDYYKSIEENN